MIPSPWIILGAVLAWLAAAVGGYAYGVHHDALAWKAKVAAQEAAAQVILATAQARVTTAVSANAELNRQLEIEHAGRIADVAAAGDAYNRAVAERVRAEGRRPRCDSPGTSATADPGHGKDVEAAGIIVREPALQNLGALMRQADITVAAMQACQTWAESVGR